MKISQLILKYNPVKSFRVTTKLGLSAGVVLLLVLFLANQILDAYNNDIEFRYKEYVGAQYVPSLYKIISHTQVTRGLTNAKLNGTPGLDNQILKNRQDALNAYDELQKFADEYGRFDDVIALANTAKRQFEAINSRAFSSSDARKIFSDYTDLITELRNLIVAIGDASNLTLDPDLDTFYLMDYLIFKAHVTAEATGVLRGRGTAIILSSDYSSASLIPFAQILGGANYEGLMQSLRSAIDANSQLSAELNPVLRRIEQAEQSFTEVMLAIIENQYSSINANDFFALGSETITTIYDGVAVVDDVLKRLLTERVDEIRNHRNFNVALSMIIFVLASFIFVATIVAIIDSLRRTKTVLACVAQGDFSNVLQVNTKDEFKELADSLNETQNKLRTNIEQERAISKEIFRIKSALDVANTPVMLADQDYNLIYMNSSAQEMLTQRADALRTVIPDFDVKNLLGTNIDRFHKTPSHQRSILTGLTDVYRAKIKIGDVTFLLTATPLFDEQGEKQGIVVEWDDATLRLQQEEREQLVAQENQRIKQALDNVSTNTMIADNDRNIVYMNNSVKFMLKNRESILRTQFAGFSVDNLLGGSMDQFHKNPSHQKDLLKNLSTTYRTQIQLQELYFGLIANPVFDDEGQRIGTVVEWEDRTDQVNIQNQIDELVQSAAHGNLSVRLPVEGKAGFFESLSKGLNQLVEISEGVVSDTARVFSALSHGDLTETIDKEYDGAFGALKNDANATVAKLTEIITQIREASSTVSTGADEIAQGNADLSQRTEEQASSLEETASSMEQMTSAVRSSADNATQANDIARETRSLASSGGAVVKDAVKAMSEINESSKHIADIIGVIDEIAFQTNLLALNAAVEAARAGEQGRGFAVVASEVRNLAQRSAAAAKEIKDLIRDSVDKVSVGSDLVNKSGETLDQIVGSVEKVSSMVNDISTSALEQSTGIEQVNKAISQMDDMTQQNAALVEEATAAGEAMAEQARKLMQQMAYFTLKESFAAVSKPVAPAVRAPKPVSKPVHGQETVLGSAKNSGLNVSDDDSDWEEF